MRELAEKIEADKERVAQLAAKVAATKQVLATATGKAVALGAEDIARNLERVEQELEQAESGRAVLEGSLEKARWQVMAAIHGIGPGAPANRSGEAGPAGVQVVGPDGEPLSEGADTLPLSLQRGEAGNAELTSAPGSFQKEHEGAEDDKGESKTRRVSQRLVRNIQSIESTSKKTAKSAYQSMSEAYEPPRNPQLYETVGTPDPPSATLGPQPAAKAAVEDTVASMLVMAVVAVEGVSRFVKARKGKSDGKLSAVP